MAETTVLPQFQMPGLTFDWNMIIDILGKGATLILVLIITLVVTYLVMYYFSFNIPLTLYYQVGNSFQKKMDMGRVKKDKNNKDQFKVLKDRRLYAALPESLSYHLQGKKQALTGVVVNNTVFWQHIHPNPGMVPVNWNANVQMTNELNATFDIIKPKLGFWDKYGTQVVLLSMGIIFLVAIIIIMQQVSKAIEMGQQVGVAAAQKNKQILAVWPLMLFSLKKLGERKNE